MKATLSNERVLLNVKDLYNLTPTRENKNPNSSFNRLYRLPSNKYQIRPTQNSPRDTLNKKIYSLIEISKNRLHAYHLKSDPTQKNSFRSISENNSTSLLSREKFTITPRPSKKIHIKLPEVQRINFGKE